MASKTIAEAQQARDAKRGKKGKDKSRVTSKGTVGSIIQSGNQAFIVDTDGKAHEIVNSPSSTAASSSTVESAHFLVTDDLDSVDPLVLELMCAADIEEYAWLATQDSFHASVDWRERRRNKDELDRAAITAAPLPTSTCCSDVALESSPFLLDSACTTHISPKLA